MSFSLDVVFYTPFMFAFLYLLANFIIKTPRHVCIIVLGDIGRSPRMQYHALSFAKEGFRVYLVGYEGSKPHENILQNESIQIYHVRKPPDILTRMPRILAYFLKVIWQSFSLAWTLLLLPKMASILIQLLVTVVVIIGVGVGGAGVLYHKHSTQTGLEEPEVICFKQNPPSIPTMLVSYAVSWVRFCDLVIDWHNYGYTILSMSLRAGHPLVKFSEWYERTCGRLSAHNICVTHAMKEDLDTNWNVRALTVYDRPSEIFKTVDVEQQHQLFTKLAKDYPLFLSSDGKPNYTRFTKKDGDGKVYKLDHRPALLVSSTSWTEDEDFGLLLQALEAYDISDCVGDGGPILPDLVCVITGKGPQKEHYSKKIAERQWKKVSFCLPWLAAEDYPVMLGSADIGVCLHMSSSGLDLPMKVVDMFGCGLPVCAVGFPCIGELVQHDKNGLIFNNSKELVNQLKQLLEGFPHKCDKLDLYRKNLMSFQDVRWHDQWKDLVLPIFHSIGKVTKPSFNPPDLFGSQAKIDGKAASDASKKKERKKDK